jgi:hypothetical protein
MNTSGDGPPIAVRASVSQRLAQAAGWRSSAGCAPADGAVDAKPSERTIQPWSSAIAIELGTCEGMPRSGGSSGRPYLPSLPPPRWTMPLCCCVSPLHSAASTGSDTVGKPTSTGTDSPRLQAAVQWASAGVTWASRPSINTTRVRGAFASPGPAPPPSSGGSPGGASQYVRSKISSRRTPGVRYANTPSAITAMPLAILDFARVVTLTPAARR